MEPRVSLITLGVADLATSLTFYHDGLGLPLASGTREQALEKGIAFFRLNRHLMLSLYPWEELAEDAQVDPESTGFRGVTLAHNVRSPEEADQVLSSAVNAGATLQKPAAETFWGGYSGYFRDPDGHLWEVAHNPFDSIVAETPPPREERLGWVGGSMALGAGASLAAHYFLDLAPGQVAAANSGFIYGYITSFIIAEFFTSTREWERALILGGLGGVAAGALIGTGLRLTAGDVALVNLGFLMSLLTVFVLDEFAWGTAVGSLLLRNEMVFLGFLMASMTAGGVVARLYPMDRIRVRMIGTGGILTALAFGFFTAVATNSDAAVLASMLLGTTAGMAGVGYATRGLDAHFRHSPDDPLLGRWQPGLAPTLDGRGATFSLTGRF